MTITFSQLGKENKTIKNHIEPQVLLKPWEIDNKLECFNKKSKTILHNQLSKNVCFQNNYIPQKYEDYFSNTYEAKINIIINNIISNNTINEDDKYFLSDFLASQKALRDPFHKYIVNKTNQDIISTFPKEYQNIFLESDIANEACWLALKQSKNDLISIYNDKRWRLITFDIPCLITNESIISLDNVKHDNYDDIVIFFPITPKHCILIYTLQKYDGDINLTAKYINNCMANIPFTNSIIFNSSFNSMTDIILIENNKKYYYDTALKQIKEKE